MNEMIYGNTGRRDEGINIDMEQALYQKLQSRTFVPKLKSMLNDRLQEGDKNFVFIGEVVDKAGAFSVYGYNAKLEHDSRGGDYGHYIAVPVNDKAVAVDTNSITFLTEEGFVEYVNLKSLNVDKRFTLSPQSMNIDVNAKKRIVNNLLETFMKVRKRKSVTFSFEDCTVDEFNAKALYALCDFIKYLPYGMRKNISFISHVASNQKLPDMINLAAYPTSSEFKPHDCITINSDTPFGSDGVFADYVEKVFAMSDEEREAYFERIYEDIEKPALEKGVDVKSDLYLLDVSTKELWTSGDVNEAISSIFGSVSDVLAVYPLYAEIARKRLTSNESEVIEYIKERIDETKSTAELKTVFTNLVDVYNLTKSNLNTNINELFKAHANRLIANANDDEEVIKVARGIASIGADIFDQECISDKFVANMNKKNDIGGIYTFYVKLKEESFKDYCDLNECLTKGVESLIIKETDKYPEAKDKLSLLEKMYNEFKTSCVSGDYSHVKKVYDKYKEIFGSEANVVAVNKGNNILYQVENEIKDPCSLFDAKNCIIKLAEIEVSANENLRQRASDIYGRVSRKMFDELKESKLTYADFKKLIQEIAPSVKALNDSKVYDEPLRNGWGYEKFVPDGMFKFVTIFESLINEVKSAESLADALLGMEKAKEEARGQATISKMYVKFAPGILLSWMKKNKKQANKSSFNKAEKEIKKRYDKQLSNTTKELFDKCLDSKDIREGGRKISGVKLAIGGVIVLAILGGLTFGGVKLYNNFFGDKTQENNLTNEGKKYYISEEEKKNVENDLSKYDKEGFKSAEILIGTISKSISEDGQNEVQDNEPVETYTITITEPLGTDYKGSIIVINDKENHFEENNKYAFVIQSSDDGKKTYLRKVIEIPQDLGSYDFDSKDDKFDKSYLKYIGEKMSLVFVGEPPKTTNGEPQNTTDGEPPKTTNGESQNTTDEEGKTDEPKKDNTQSSEAENSEVGELSTEKTDSNGAESVK